MKSSQPSQRAQMEQSPTEGEKDIPTIEPPPEAIQTLPEKSPLGKEQNATHLTGQPEGIEAEPETHLHGLSLHILAAALCLVVFFMMLNASIVGTAIPKITSQFHSLNDVGWYGSAYLIANCAILPLAGKIYTHCRLKATFLSFLWLFAFGSIISGAANGSRVSIAGRAISGVGGSGLSSGSLAVINAAAPLEKRPMLIGLVMSFSTIGGVIGPVIGGALTQGATWRWCFYINAIAVGITTVVILVVRFPTRAEDKIPFSVKVTLRNLDLTGFLIFAPACTIFLMALQWGGTTYPWNSSVVIGLCCGSAGFISLFLVWQYHKGDRAMLPLKMLSRRVVLCSSATIGFQMGTLMELTYYLPLWFQAVKNADPIMSGVMTLPMSVSQIAYSVISGWLVDKTGYYTLWAVVGCGLTAVGTGLMCTFTPSTGAGKWIGYQIPIGAGRSMVMQMCVIAVQKDLPKEQENIGSTFLMFCQFLSGAVLIAVAQTIFTNSLSPALQEYAPTTTTAQIIGLGALALRTLPKKLIPGVVMAYNRSLVHSYYLATAGAALGFLASFGMGWGSLKKGKS